MIRRQSEQLETNELGALEARVGGGLAEGAARDAFGDDGEAPRFEQELLVTRIEAEERRLAAVVGKRDQTLAAEVEREPRFAERPSLRDRGGGLEPRDALAARPGGVKGDRLAVEAPAVDVERLALAPIGELVDARP